MCRQRMSLSGDWGIRREGREGRKPACSLPVCNTHCVELLAGELPEGPEGAGWCRRQTVLPCCMAVAVYRQHMSDGGALVCMLQVEPD